MPRRNRTEDRRDRPRDRAAHDEPTTDDLARSLVVRGLASHLTLGPVRRPIINEQEPHR